jgi:hypothetical protein
VELWVNKVSSNVKKCPKVMKTQYQYLITGIKQGSLICVELLLESEFFFEASVIQKFYQILYVLVTQDLEKMVRDWSVVHYRKSMRRQPSFQTCSSICILTCLATALFLTGETCAARVVRTLKNRRFDNIE